MRQLLFTLLFIMLGTGFAMGIVGEFATKSVAADPASACGHSMICLRSAAKNYCGAWRKPLIEDRF